MNTRERTALHLNGFFMLLVSLLVMAGGAAVFVNAAPQEKFGAVFAGIGIVMLGFVCLRGLFIVPPNQAKALLFFGRYIGTVRTEGFWWGNPLASRVGISLRVQNFNSEKLKVNDLRGNPIEIAAVVVWRVTESARALLDVESHHSFVEIQSETVVRNLASNYPYDPHDNEDGKSLLSDGEEIADRLKEELQRRLEVAGVEILDARLTHLAYSPEIAQAMLRRQQAEALVAARFAIVEGAVSMVQLALEKLRTHEIVDLDEERKAQMVNNLMVALVSEHETAPIINAGSIY